MIRAAQAHVRQILSPSLPGLRLALAGLLLVACKPTTPEGDQAPATGVTQMSAADKALRDEAMSYCQPLPLKPASPQHNPTTQAKIALGRQLFHDPRLSPGGKLSCNSCHNLADYGVDHRKTAVGHGLRPRPRNVPTAYNTGLYTAQLWDGRAAHLESLLEQPLHDSGESAAPADQVYARLRAIPGYASAFAAAFPESKGAVNAANSARALAAYQRTLLTPAPFDRFLLGDGGALSAPQKAGLRIFMDLGCIACHGGPSFGGGMLQKFGMLTAYANREDTGRFLVSKDGNDKYVFKVPSLRNVTRTAPYFHDGGVSELKEAIRTMDRTQLGQNLQPDAIDKIATFLESLSGELPAAELQPPQLPPG